MGVLIWLVTFVILVSSSAATCCNSCLRTSSVSSTTANIFSGGFCEYGIDSTEFNGYYPAAAVGSIYRAGKGCGATYQVRCTENTKYNLCSTKGIHVIVVTSATMINGTDIVLSEEAFKGLFIGNKTNLNNVRIEYKRVQTVYDKTQNMSVRAETLAHTNKDVSIFKFLYQGGQTYITKIAMVFKGKSYWLKRRNEGATWQVIESVVIPLSSNVTFQFTAINGTTEETFTSGNVQLGQIKVVYSLGIQLHNITAPEECETCDSSNWN